MYPPTPIAITTQAVAAAPAMAAAGVTPLSVRVFGGGVAPELMPIGAPTAPEEGGDGDAVAVVLVVAVPVAVPVAVALPVAAPEGVAGVVASPDPVPVPVGVPVAELDGRIYTEPVALLLGYAVGLALSATIEGVAV